MKKLVPLLFAIVGFALVIAALVVWFEPPKDGGVFSTAGAIISFLVGAGASIKGWMDVFKKDDGEKNTQTQTQSQTVNVNITTPSTQSPITDHQLLKNTLPPEGFFIGREKEREIIQSALSPESRTWGALIDGPGGIGKTALAIKAAHESKGLFERKIFITAKVRELTPEGEKPRKLLAAA